MPLPDRHPASNSGRKASQKAVSIVDLSVGDVVLFSEKNGAFVSVRSCRWIAYTFAAFVVAIDPESADVELCGHFPTVATDTEFTPSHTPSTQRFRTHLQYAKYEAIYVRRLRHALDDKEFAALQHFAQRVCAPGAVSPPGSHASDEEVVILMAPMPGSFLSRLSCAPRVERFLTTRLVGDMLVTVGQAQDDGHRFVASTVDERVLLPVQELSAAEFARAHLSSRRIFKSARSMSASGADELDAAP